MQVSSPLGSPSAAGSKKGAIGKRKAVDEEDTSEQGLDSEEFQKRKSHEKRVRSALAAFLSSKGVDIARHLANLEVILTLRTEPYNPRKKGPSANSGDRYKVSFKTADGVVCNNQGEVYAAIQASSSKNTASSSSASSILKKPIPTKTTSPKAVNASSASSASTTSNTSAHRKNAHEAAMHAVAAITHYPAPVGDSMLVHNLGNLDPRPGYQSATQLYPLGYRAQVTIPNDEANRAFVGITAGRSKVTLPQSFLCSIKPGSAAPSFKMQNILTNETFVCDSEEEAFRSHFPGILRAGTDTSSGSDGHGDAQCGGLTGMTSDGLGPWTSIAPFSFFNYEVEKLLEGLKGALLCNKYKMHCERLPAYTDQVGCDSVKRAQIISRFNAANAPVEKKPKAPKATPVSASVTPAATSDTIGAAFKKQGVTQNSQEKEEMRRQQDELKRQQKAARDLEKRIRDAEKREEMRIKEEQRKLKMQQALHNKYRNAYRPDVKKVILKNAKVSFANVYEKFDVEEKESSISSLLAEIRGNKLEDSVDAADDDGMHTESGSSLNEVLAQHAHPCMDAILTGLPDLLNDGLEPLNDGKEVKDCDYIAKALPASMCDPLLRLSTSLSLYKDLLMVQSTPTTAKHIARCMAAVASEREAYIAALKVDPEHEETTIKKEIKEEEPVAMDVASDKPEDTPLESSEAQIEEVEATFEDLPAEIEEPAEEEEGESTAFVPAIMRSNAHADLDRIALCLTQAVSGPLHTLLELDDEALSLSSSNNAASLHQVRLPLNQMTFTDIARMALIARVMPQLEFTNDETKCLLRGGAAAGVAGRQTSSVLTYRTNRNVIRHIRYRMVARTALIGSSSVCDPKEEKHSSLPEDRLEYLRKKLNKSDTHSYKAHDENLRKEGLLGSATAISQVPDTEFDDANDYASMISALLSVADSQTHSDTYRRCAKVLHKICSLTCGKGLIWDQSHREYLQTIRQPMSLSAVATRLCQRSYGDSDDDVAFSFYSDMRLTAINAIVYHSEAMPHNANSHKAMLAMHRYTYEWVFSPRRPAVADCVDTLCILSRREVNNQTQIKCGRCTAPYNLEALHEASIGNADKNTQEALSYPECLISPSQELVDKPNEEWMCPLCLEEDSVSMNSTVLHSHQQAANANGSVESYFLDFGFWVDESGPSSHLPWHINPKYSRALIKHVDDNPRLIDVMCKAFSLLANPTRSILQATVPSRKIKEGEAILLGLSAATVPDFTSDDIQAVLNQYEQPWTPSDWTCVMTAMNEMLKGFGGTKTADSVEAFDRIYERKGSLQDLCLKLINLSLQSSPFKETEFMRVVKDIAGEEGFQIARRGLDKINAEKSSSTGELRECMFAAGFAANDSSTTFSDSVVVDKFRDKDTEENLLNRAIDIKAAVDPNTKNKEKLPERVNADLIAKEKIWAECKCQYCGLSELDVCSPFVVGQSPRDHAYHQSRHGEYATLYADGGELEAPLPGPNSNGNDMEVSSKPFTLNNTQVFIHAGLNDFKPPPLNVPYFPPVESLDGRRLLQIMGYVHNNQIDLTGASTPNLPEGAERAVIVHHSCAMLMFKARVERKNHESRRLRRDLAQKIIGLTGLYTVYLGTDIDEREYWRFPTEASSAALFICTAVPADPVEQEFRQYMSKGRSKRKESHNDKVSDSHIWSMITELDGVKEVLRAVRLSAGKRGLSNGKQERVRTLANELSVLVDNLECCKPTEPIVVKDDALESKSIKEELSEPVPDGSMDVENKVSEPNIIDVDAEAATDAEKGGPSDTPTSEPVMRERRDREAAGGIGSWLVRGGSGTKDDKISYLHGVKKGAGDAASFDQFAFSDPKNMNLPESQPVELKFMHNKGVSVLPHYLIPNQSAFDEKRPMKYYVDEYDGTEEVEDVCYEEYLYFNSRGKKYLVLALYNKLEKKVRVPKGSVRMRYEIYRQGQSDPLTSIDLDEMWSDGLYYFTAPTFRRDGQYRYVFTAEPIPEYAAEGKPAVDLRFLKPVTFDITVDANETFSGAKASIDKLEAHKYTNKSGRRKKIDKITFSGYDYFNALKDSCDGNYITECNAVKLALLTVFNALPFGSLTLPDEATDGIRHTGVAHATGWSDDVEDAWYTCLVRSSSPQELMECMLLLEYYIAKGWLEAPLNRLQQALPAYHMAMRCATYSSVSLRIFCLDRALSYSTVVKESRADHLARGTGQANSSRRSTNVTSYTEDSMEFSGDDDDHDGGDEGGRGRSKRGAAQAASSRIRNQSDKGYQVYDEEDAPSGGRRAGRPRKSYVESDDEEDEHPAGQPADSWTCVTCTMKNGLRARSCEACGEKRSAVANNAPKKRNSHNQTTSDDDDEEGEEDYDWSKMIDECLPDDDDEVPDAKADAKIRQLSLLRFLYNDPRTEIFWSPVPEGTPQYFDIIEVPMDFGTITDKVLDDVYFVDDGESTSSVICEAAHEAFYDDIELVFANCKQYNQKGPLVQLSAEVGEVFQGKYDSWISDTDRPSDPNMA